MIKHQDKKRKQDLGIFYTPQEVADFIFEILNIWKKNQATRWKTVEGKQKYPSVIDPAVGEGGFLKVAIEKNFTKPDWIFGLDIDENAVKRWKEINLLKDFGGKEKDLEAHFFHQNGLDRIHWEQHTKKYRYKLKQEDILNQQFDVVVGNPPYGGLGIYDEMILLSQAITGSEKIQKINTQILDDLFGGQEVKQSKQTVTLHKKISLPEQRILELKSLSKALLGFEVWKDDKLRINRLNHTVSIGGTTFNLKDVLDVKEIERLKSFPIEILFLERFIQLAKLGGWIAIVIPDGILTNSNSDYVREFISRKTKIEAIVSLPRNTFKNAGTSAKTSILFLRKLKPNEKVEQDYPVFLSSLESINSYNFQKIVDAYQKFYNKKEKNMDKSQLVQITKDQNGREAVMLRVDMTLKKMMEEKPASRLDPNYWHPIFTELENDLESRFKCQTIGDIQEFLTLGHVGKMQYLSDGEVPVVGVKDILTTGINPYSCKKIEKGGPIDLPKRRIKESDLLFVRSGVGSVGRTVVVTDLFNCDLSISGDIYLLRSSKINLYFLAVFLNGNFGYKQIERIGSGVSGQIHLNFPEFGRIVIPLIEQNIQNNIEKKYLVVARYHRLAIYSFKNGNKTEYKKNMGLAEDMLKDLITKTEEVIRGERSDVT